MVQPDVAHARGQSESRRPRLSAVGRGWPRTSSPHVRPPRPECPPRSVIAARARARSNAKTTSVKLCGRERGPPGLTSARQRGAELRETGGVAPASARAAGGGWRASGERRPGPFVLGQQQGRRVAGPQRVVGQEPAARRASSKLVAGGSPTRVPCSPVEQQRDAARRRRPPTRAASMFRSWRWPSSRRGSAARRGCAGGRRGLRRLERRQRRSRPSPRRSPRRRAARRR